MTCRVFLYDETLRAFACALFFLRCARRRLGSLRVITLCRILAQAFIARTVLPTARPGCKLRRRTGRERIGEKLRQRLAQFEHRCKQVTDLFDSPNRGGWREVESRHIATFDSDPQFVPGNRHRDKWRRPLGAHCINANGRFEIRVLTPIDQHLAPPQGLGHFRHNAIGHSVPREFGDGLRERLRHFVSRVRIERNAEMQPFGAGHLDERFEVP